MTLPRATPGHAWKVTGQVEAIELDKTNRPVKGYLVSFTTGANHAGTVFVPRDQYTQANVRAAVAEHAQVLDQVGQLQG